MLHRDGQPLRGLDQRSVHVAGDIALGPSRIALLQVFVAVLIQAALGRTHGDDMRKTIAALIAHVVGYGAKAMAGIEVAVAQGVFGASPEALAGFGKELVAKVVNISPPAGRA